MEQFAGEMKKNLNTIIIGSAGRNTGKTELACRIIKNNLHENVVGLKVVCFDPDDMSCHRGGGDCYQQIADAEKLFCITEDLDASSDKDTSRMLKAGAKRAFLLHAKKEAMESAVSEFMSLLPNDTLIVAESNSLRLHLQPSLFIVIRNAGDNSIKKTCAAVIDFADIVTTFNTDRWDIEPERIFTKNNKWFYKHNATAIILAGGKSSRMGGDKSLLTIEGRPLIENIVEQLQPHFDKILIGANDIEKFSFLKLPVIPDLYKDMGPLAGILSCLLKSDHNTNFITACDIPEMNQSFIDRMLFMSVDTDIVMPQSNGDTFEPLYAVYNKSVVTYIQDIIANDGRKITKLLDYSKVRYVNFINDGWYFNLNRKADLNVYIEQKKCTYCK